MAGFVFRSKKGKDIEVPVPPAPLADTHGHLTCFRTLDVADALAHAALAGLRLLVVPELKFLMKSLGVKSAKAR